MESKKVKDRSEIDLKYKWDLSTMYANDELWEDDYEKVSKLADEFTKYQGNVTVSSDMLLSALRDIDSIDLLLGKMICYAKMKQDEDNTNSKYQELFGRGMTDHPRLRGNYAGWNGNLDLNVGSPPLTRELLAVIYC